MKKQLKTVGVIVAALLLSSCCRTPCCECCPNEAPVKPACGCEPPQTSCHPPINDCCPQPRFCGYQPYDYCTPGWYLYFDPS